MSKSNKKQAPISLLGGSVAKNVITTGSGIEGATRMPEDQSHEQINPRLSSPFIYVITRVRWLSTRV